MKLDTSKELDGSIQSQSITGSEATRRLLGSTENAVGSSGEAAALHFSFTYLGLQGTDLWLLLVFDNPDAVSMAHIYSQLTVEFKTSPLLVSATTQIPLAAEPFVTPDSKGARAYAVLLPPLQPV